ncbi:hypothetical protein AXY43_15800 [Clostridium sp. MF28]|uniref:TetR/AcrR family transcriptional regulator n=1 Tax=Clostridium TaxID=1485 RepID=UPI000D206FF0|nr:MULTISPECIES: TetR family transcriptional regulator [Clostridium]AVK49344.1 hypothetical protein AXY43_15800 [Clostridium sp. MF28]
MGRPKNTQNRDLIAKTAFNLFLNKGYNKTSYKDIADNSSNERTLIQYYFPKKELLITDFLNKLLSLSEQYITEKSLKSDNNFINLYIIGQIHFSFLLMNDEMKTLTLDIVSNRAITKEIVFFNENWVFSFFNLSAELNKELSDDIVMIMGGTYELIYRYISKSESLNVPNLLKKIMLHFLTAMGHENSIYRELLSSHALSEETLCEANSYLKTALLK